MHLSLAAALPLIVLFAVPAHAASAPKASRAVELRQGEITELRVAAEEGSTIEAWLGKEAVYFFPVKNGHYAALMGADVDAKPGRATVRLRMVSATGVAREQHIEINVKAKAFKQESFNVDPGFDQMTPENLAEIRRERAAFARAYGATSAERFWDAPFFRPVPQEASASSFGFRRIINGVARAPHSGTDLSAPAGTEVIASNHGRVILVGNFFFAGGSVVLDHGAGLQTMYFHLSEFKVAEGDMVRKGEVIALSGMTGRVTGAHLHWGVRANGARVDPMQLLEKFGAKGHTAAAAPAGGRDQ
jgi:murein DD-endopeptidase MepM/ murein hydrolase activator NlpD